MTALYDCTFCDAALLFGVGPASTIGDLGRHVAETTAGRLIDKPPRSDHRKLCNRR
jgi:hypothetical protein